MAGFSVRSAAGRFWLALLLCPNDAMLRLVRGAAVDFSELAGKGFLDWQECIANPATCTVLYVSLSLEGCLTSQTVAFAFKKSQYRPPLMRGFCVHAAADGRDVTTTETLATLLVVAQSAAPFPPSSACSQSCSRCEYFNPSPACASILCTRRG